MSDNYHRVSITKRDGKKEPFNPDKIVQVAEAAGLEVSQAVKLAQSISEWLSGLKTKGVTSLQLRDRIQKELISINPRVADLFRWYQKTKDLKRK